MDDELVSILFPGHGPDAELNPQQLFSAPEAGVLSLADAAEAAGILHNDDGLDHGCTTVDVAADYPDCLTETQRTMFSRHVAFHIRRYDRVHDAVLLIRRGWKALAEVRGRLQSEKEELVAGLAAVDQSSTAASATSEGGTNTSNTDTAAPAVVAATAAPSRRPGGGRFFQRSALFSRLQSAVAATVLEDQARQQSDEARSRKRVDLTTRLALLADDLTQHDALLQPLSEKLHKAEELEATAQATLAELLPLLEEMSVMEARYAVSFALRAVAHGEPSANTYDIPFMPANITADVAEIIRGQVEEQLANYLSYRARIDPIVGELEQQALARRAERAEALRDVLGVGQYGGDGHMTDLIFAPSARATHGSTVSGPLSFVEDVVGSSRPLRRPGAGISDSDGEDEMQHRVGGEVVAADGDDGDRQRIQNALSALDDFEEMY